MCPPNSFKGKQLAMRYFLIVGWITFVLHLRSGLPAFGQTTASLTGRVADAISGNPMPFAHVYVNGSTQGAVTDEKGHYKLTGVPLGTIEIAASFVGYQPVMQKIRFENASLQKADFQLKPSEQMLDAVTVRGNSKRSEKQLRQFKKQLFGEPFGSQCLLVNPEVLNFKEDKNSLYATADGPVIIDNQALGYRLIYDLKHFNSTPSGKVYFAGAARFEELKPENEKQADRFRRNRMTAYRGSTRHLMASLIDGTFGHAGFLVYQEDVTRSFPLDRRTITLAAAVGEYKRLVPVQVSKLIQYGRLPTERRLVSPMKLIVFYTKASSGFSPYPDARYAYTEIKLPGEQMQMTVDGVITMPEGMEAEGSMGDDRLSTMLPADWKPEGSAMESPATGPMASQGKLAPSDTCLAGIREAFNKRFKLLAPTLFVHIDKPFYTTGDRLWMSTYLLDAASHQQAAGETAMHIDLLTSAGKLVEHQWVHIENGRGQANFRLSDTLVTGLYRLRAYTDEDDTHRGPAFERSVSIYNLFRSTVAIPKDTVDRQPDIQILPEGGRWISGLQARLGIKILTPDGHGLSIDGRIADDLGVEAVRFKTNPQGMTSVSMEPKAQRTYYADVFYKNQLLHIPLPKTEYSGLVLSADAISDTAHLAITIMSAERTFLDSVYVLIQQRGVLVDQRKVLLRSGVAKLSLPMMDWLPGLAQVTLYDARAKPQCERMFFVPESIVPVGVKLTFNKAKYRPREQVVLSVNLNDNGSPVSAALSASVTDAGKVPEDTASATLPAHLLLTGELRGSIENPNQYVIRPTKETRKALDDLLLTQGWRRVTGTLEADSLGGVSLAGRILNAENKPLSGAKVVAVSTSRGQSFVRSIATDHQGRFRLAGMDIADTVQIMLQIVGPDGKKNSAKEAFLVQEGPGKLWEAGKMNAHLSWPVHKSQLEAARIRQQANTDLYRDKTVELLKEVTVLAQKRNDRPEDIQMRSLHNNADAVVTFNEKSPKYSNLYEMIQGRFAGVTVVRTTPLPTGPPTPPGYQVSIRGISSFKSGTQPLFLMDGVPVQDPDRNALMNFNPGDIERVEVLKTAATAGIYGVRGGNGVIAFYTKRTRSMQANAKMKDGMTTFQFVGYPKVQREFYVPRYGMEASGIGISGNVDDRDVLYWKPLIQADRQGKSQLSFPLSDAVQTLRVVIQGVTATGRPVLGIQWVQVQ